MSADFRLKAVLVLLAVVGMLARPTDATTIKSGSHYGPNDPDFAHCKTSSSPCEAATDTGTLVSINGTNYEEFQLTTGSTIDALYGTNVFDVFDFGKITADSLINLPFTSWGILTCGYGTGALSSAVDSSGTSSVTGLPCTPIDNLTGTGIPLSGGTTLYSTVDAFGNNVAFTLLANGSIRFNSDFSDVVFFTADTGSATALTPEPGSLALLGTGIVALWAKFGRRKQA
jgi:hypothetical protein